MATDNKYDRQLRLWGGHGQRALMESHILLITASGTGSETLKNLVLPGIGRITVMDEAIVSPRDLGNNFFVTKESVGLPRAQVVCELLLEMNDDVKGQHRVANVCDVIDSEPEYFDQFTMIIATQTTPAQASKIAVLCETKDIPLLVVRSFGLVGSCRLYSRSHTIVEARPDSEVPDLRLADPFPALRAFADSFDLASLDNAEHAHVPFVVLLLKAGDAWKAQHNGSLPRTMDEKEAFRQSIKAMTRQDYGHEVNFLEAVKESCLAYVIKEVPYEVQTLLDDGRASTLTADTPSFWVLVRALRDFVADPLQGAGQLPLSGQIPDMTATTDHYIAMQRLFKQKASDDVGAVRARVTALLQGLQKDPNSISDEEVALFCKNAYNLLELRYRTLAEEAQAASEDLPMVFLAEPSPDAPAVWYFLLRAADAFHAAHGRFPGEADNATAEELATDAAAVKELGAKLLDDLGIMEPPITDKHYAEITRFGAAEVHHMAAFMGGLAAQEAVKLITHQYIPLNNTYIYNGVACTGGVIEG